MDLDELKLLLRRIALANALKYNGKSNVGTIIAGAINEYPDLKKTIKVVSLESKDISDQVNSMKLEDIRKELEDKFPDMLEKKEKKEERNIFAFLNIKDGDKIRTGFPPGPEKYPHIGHIKALLMNHMLAKQYNGEFILRFEDTNPELVKSEFYDIMQDNFRWLGVEWNELMYASDHMNLFYEYAEKIINQGHAYMCFCDGETIKKGRAEGIECKHRNHTPAENLVLWREFPTYEEGKAILRLKIDLLHQNTTMRDPTIFRIIRTPHARHGTKYTVWPNYDWQNAIMDGYFGFTHRLRSKEFEMRNELQRYVQKMLGFNQTNIYEFARFNLEGVDTSGRIIREKITSGKYIGWDDPRLATIVALRRRGFVPESIKNFVLSTGITKSESTLTWDDMIVQNRRILDKTAKRFFMMHDYEKIIIHNSPHQNITLKSHPDKEELGTRSFETEQEFLIQKSDLKEITEDGLYRFMDCLNFRKSGNILSFDSLEYERFKSEGKKIMHWLPAYGNIDIEIFMNDATTIKGVAEHNIRELKVGDIIQFERFGFCKLDSIEGNKHQPTYRFWFTHR
jgi:glutamyl-tRNA synthetase